MVKVTVNTTSNTSWYPQSCLLSYGYDVAGQQGPYTISGTPTRSTSYESLLSFTFYVPINHTINFYSGTYDYGPSIYNIKGTKSFNVNKWVKSTGTAETIRITTTM
jgi:hypothetical protein